MQLLTSPNSLFGRKVLIAAHALGLSDKITIVATNPRADDATLRPKNPLGKIPALITDDGTAIADSFAIILYLQSLAGKTTFFPNSSAAQATLMFHHAVADGIGMAAVLMAQNKMRHDECSGVPLDDTWIKRQVMAASHGLEFMDKNIKTIGTDLNVATAALITSLDYLHFRFPEFGGAGGWRAKHKNLAAWLDTMHKNPAVAKTNLPA
ncbi:MAG: glutathione S-transferase family protein [Hydrotalea sp.]|nr:glutathione S-transferase family protein [Hydrotalea sp.]